MDSDPDIKTQFAMYLTNDENNPGAFTFSGYDLESYAVPNAKDEDINWFPIDKINMRNFWTLDSTGLYDSTDDPQLISTSHVSVILNTKKDFSLLSQRLFSNVLKAF